MTNPFLTATLRTAYLVRGKDPEDAAAFPALGGGYSAFDGVLPQRGVGGGRGVTTVLSGDAEVIEGNVPRRSEA